MINKWYWPFPIAQFLNSSNAIVFGREVYGDDSNWFIDIAHTMLRSMSNLIYEFKYRFVRKHKHNVIYTDLEPGFWCEDSRILYGCMKCLMDHIESEGGEIEFEKWTQELLAEEGTQKEILRSQGARQAEAEALAIYRWWKYEKPKDQARSDELMSFVYADWEIKFEDSSEHPEIRRMIFPELSEEKKTAKLEMQQLDEKIENDEQAMLHRLIDIRHSLWT